AQGGRSSWGGALPRISRLVIVDGAVHIRRPTPGGGQTGGDRSINDPGVAAQAGAFFQTQTRADNSLVTRKVTTGPIFQEAVEAPALKTLKVPTLVMWGDGDQLIPLADGKQIASEIP